MFPNKTTVASTCVKARAQYFSLDKWGFPAQRSVDFQPESHVTNDFFYKNSNLRNMLFCRDAIIGHYCDKTIAQANMGQLWSRAKFCSHPSVRIKKRTQFFLWNWYCKGKNFSWNRLLGSAIHLHYSLIIPCNLAMILCLNKLGKPTLVSMD